MLRSFGLVLGCLLAGGCAYLTPVSSLISTPQNGPPPLQVHEQTSVKLAQNDFALVKTNVVGRSKGLSLFGLITIYPATVTKVVSRMYGAAQMKPGESQTLAHLIIEQTSTFWILFSIPKVEVSADIVEFKSYSPRAPPAAPDGE